jgi:hypothetical protein
VEVGTIIQQAPPPVIVRIIPPEEVSELEGLADVLLGSLGLAGAALLLAVLLAGVFAGLLFAWRRWRGPQDADEPTDLRLL